MIRLFISDIDGCLAQPYQPFDGAGMAKLAALAASAETSGLPAPRVSLCSGRPYAYVEAMSQLLGLQQPVLFESGGGMFDPVKAAVTWNPVFSPEAAEKIEAVRHWLIHDVVPGTTLMFDYNKRTQAGIIGPVVEEVQQLVPVVEEYVTARFEGLYVFHTEVSIDVAVAGMTKGDAVGWLSEKVGVPIADMAFIGDSNGDLPALERVGAPLAPANATGEVKSAARYVSSEEVLDGVLDCYDWCIRQNQSTS